jgi:hypothetical protein
MTRDHSTIIQTVAPHKKLCLWTEFFIMWMKSLSGLLIILHLYLPVQILLIMHCFEKCDLILMCLTNLE